MKKFEMAQKGMVRSSDLSRGMTLRNANENRRLVGHLQHLDLQLHNNLVNLQAEISDLRLSRHKQRPKTSHHRGMKAPIGKTLSNPKNVNDRQFRSGPAKISPLAVQGSNTLNTEISSKPFLPQISAKHTALVSKRIDCDESVRPHPPRSPSSARRLRNAAVNSTSNLSKSNLNRPKSTPDLSTSSSTGESASAEPTSSPHNDVGRARGPLEKNGLVSRSSGDLCVSPVQLNDRVSDFLKRPNMSSSKRKEKRETEELKRTANDVIPKITIEQEVEAELSDTDSDTNAENTVHDEQAFLIDEELFRNSLLLKASRDDGLSRSMPDVSSLGFMDFNEVIDQRLRKLQEEIPSEKEMRKIRYLRFRDEPAPLPLKEIFEKENHHEHLDKIDE